MGIASLLLSFFIAALVVEATTQYNVLDYGATGDSKTDDTAAFLKAWAAACADKEPTTLIVPSQKNFLLSQIAFQGPCKSSIHVEIEGTLVAPGRKWTNDQGSHWILFSKIDGLTIDGAGQVDGQGAAWWDCKARNQCDQLPNSFGIESCNEVRVSGLHFVNSPGKHLTVHSSVGVHISSVTIAAPGDSPNTDGMHIEESQHVEVTNSTIGTGDDCISIGTGCSDVNVTRITCGPGHGISIGSLGVGDTKASVEGVRVYNCSFINTMYGARVKTWQGGSGFAKTISFELIRFDSVDQPILIDQYYCNGGTNCQNSTSAVQVSDVSFVDARGTASKEVAVRFACSESVACTGIVLRDVSITPIPGLDKQSTYCLNAVGSKAGEIDPDVSCLSRLK